MRLTVLRAAGIAALAAMLVAAACGGSSSSGTSTTSTTSGGTSTATTSGVSSPVASPVASPQASPSAMTGSPAASPMASPSALSSPVTLATAFSNLEAKNSYVLNMTLSGFPGVGSLISNASSSQQVTLTRSGNDRHMVVNNASGSKVAELWQVGGKTWVDIGAGPIQVPGTNSAAGQVQPILGAPALFMQKVSGDQGAYQVTGQDTVNGISTTVEKASYTVNNPAIAGLLPAGTSTVTSTIWVANDGQYLVKADMTINQGSGTPTTGQGAHLTLIATQIGSAPSIQAPQ